MTATSTQDARVRSLEQAVARFREALARRKALDPAAAGEWHAAEIASLIGTLAGRAARGAVVRRRLAHSEGLVLCGPRVRLYHPWHVSAGSDLYLDEACEIVGLSRRGIVFGDRCTVGRFATIQPTNKLMGEIGEGMRVGDRSNIGPFSYIGCSGYVDIGSDVLMGPRVTLIAENHVFDDAGMAIKTQGVRREEIRVENDCWLGTGTIVLAGVTIGRGSVIAAGSVVNSDIPPFSVAGGVPARVLRRRDDQAGASDRPPSPSTGQ
jgi:acetyltransferase-like isoleucine patch superfamily enzyme